MISEKEQLRKEYKIRRKSLSAEELERKSLAIKRHFETWISMFPEFQHVHIFLPIERQKEVNTIPILEFLLEKGKTLYTSLVDPDTDEMKTVEINRGTDYQLDPWGIPVPKEPVFVSPEKIQVILIPLLVVDQKGNRIGFGKGYYDMFLSKLSNDILKVGLSLFPPVAQITSENHDIPLSYCITPEKVLTF